MRFAAVIVPPQPAPQRAPAAEFLRRLVAGEPLSQAFPANPPSHELPADLDQRVRLVGEW
jgi:hypothetical protein